MTTLASKVTRPAPCAVPGAFDGEEIEPEEERRGDALEVAAKMARVERQARADQRRAAEEAERSPATVAPATRRRNTSQVTSTTKTGAVVARNVAFATVVSRMARCQKKRSPAKARPARSARTSEGFPRPGIVRLLEPHPSVEHRQRQRDAPEGAGERPDPSAAANRTKIAEKPSATAPATSAINADAAPESSRAVVSEEVMKMPRWAVNQGPELALPELLWQFRRPVTPPRRVHERHR